MSRNYRTYTKQFKLEALELLASSGKSAAQIERDLGITKELPMTKSSPKRMKTR